MLPSQKVRSRLTTEQCAIHDWFYDATRNPAVATFLMGMSMAIGAEDPKKTYWDVMKEVRDRVQVIYAQTDREQ